VASVLRTLKVALVSLEQARWLEEESKRLGVSQAELIRQGIERLRAGPPARRPSDGRSWYRSRPWLSQQAGVEPTEMGGRWADGLERSDDAYD